MQGKIWATLLVFGVALLSFGTQELEITHHSKWAILGMGVLLALSFQVGKVHWSLIAPFFITALSAFLLGSYPRTFSPPNFDLVEVLATGNSASWALATFLMVVGYVATRTHEELKSILLAYGAVGLLISLIFLLNLATFGALPVLGVIGNYSMTGSLIALSMPFAYHLLGAWVFFPMLLAILLMFASTPYAVAGVVMVCLLPKLWQRIALIASGVVPLFIFPDLLNPSGRFLIWTVTKPYLSLIGAGGGISQILVPKEQLEKGVSAYDLFFHLHNDWLQLLLENGYIGVFAYLVLFWQVVKKAKGHPIYLAPVLGFAVCAFFNYPAHMALHALFGTVLVFAVFRENSWAR